MIISFIYYVTLSKFVDSYFSQCNVHTGVQGGCLAFTPLGGYLKLYLCEGYTCYTPLWVWSQYYTYQN